MIGVPTCITQVEKKAVIEAALMSGVREVHLVEEPMAAAIGANIPVHKAEGNMIIDIGGGTSDIASYLPFSHRLWRICSACWRRN